MCPNIKLVLIVMLQISVIGLSHGNAAMDEQWYFDAVEGMQNNPKCHVRRSWKHAIPPYGMTCFQCNDKEHTVIMYHGTEALGAVSVASCDYYDLPSSVSVLEPLTMDGSKIHRVQFMIGLLRVCVRLNYRFIGGKWQSERKTCTEAPGWKRMVYKSYVHGWKLVLDAPNLGIVRYPLRVGKGLTEGCRKIREIDHELRDYMMTCYDCKDEFKAVVFRFGEVMAAANVGSCRKPNLETSISVVKPTDSAYRVQCYGIDAKCVMVEYDWNIQITTVKERCVYARQNKVVKTGAFMAVSGIINGWKNKKDDHTNNAKTRY